MDWIVGIVASIVAGVFVGVVFTLFLNSPLERAKKRLDEGRTEARTKRQRKNRETLIRSLIDGVHGRTTRVLSSELAVVYLTVLSLVGLFMMYGGILAAAVIHGSVYTPWCVGIMGGVAMVAIPKYFLKQHEGEHLRILISDRVRIVTEAIRDVATKEEVRNLAIARIDVTDERSLGRFVILLYNTAKKYGLANHVAILVIWPEHFVREFSDLPEEERSLMQCLSEESEKGNGGHN